MIITKCAKAPIDRESEAARNGAFILEVTTHYQHNSIIADSASASDINLSTPKVTGTEVLGGGRRGESITTEVTVIVEVSTMSLIVVSMIRVNRTQILFIFSKTNVDNHCWYQGHTMSKDNNNCLLILSSYYTN